MNHYSYKDSMEIDFPLIHKENKEGEIFQISYPSGEYENMKRISDNNIISEFYPRNGEREIFSILLDKDKRFFSSRGGDMNHLSLSDF